MNRLIESIKDAPHDALIVAGMFSIPVLIALWIVNRMRHPERGLLHALVIASVGFVLVPCVSSGVLILWVRTGGDSMQAAFVSMFVFVAGCWAVSPIQTAVLFLAPHRPSFLTPIVTVLCELQ